MKFTKSALLAGALAVTCMVAAGRDAAAAEKHFLWKVTGGKGMAYVLGTIHVGTKDLYPLAPVIEDAFSRSDALIEELDPTQTGELLRVAQDIIKDGIYPVGDSLANHLSKATQEQLEEYAKTNPLGPGYARAKPWLLSLMVMQVELKQLGLDKTKGLDLHFIEEATQAKKPIEALETAAFQIKLFSSFTDALQDQLLMTTLLDAQKATKIVDLTLQAWRAGDSAQMESVITGEVREHPFLRPVMEKLLYERNAAMTQKIEAALETGKTYFVAVGAGHLVGERGILEALRRRNYAIEQL